MGAFGRHSIIEIRGNTSMQRVATARKGKIAPLDFIIEWSIDRNSIGDSVGLQIPAVQIPASNCSNNN